MSDIVLPMYDSFSDFWSLIASTFDHLRYSYRTCLRPVILFVTLGDKKVPKKESTDLSPISEMVRCRGYKLFQFSYFHDINDFYP